ncbi:MAG: hypothetical protein PHH73_00225 [Candidatus Rickettsiella isopodorum]|nr:hypothetical protein [Candidatus Rickettsiella isopodorum]
MNITHILDYIFSHWKKEKNIDIEPSKVRIVLNSYSGNKMRVAYKVKNDWQSKNFNKIEDFVVWYNEYYSKKEMGK